MTNFRIAIFTNLINSIVFIIIIIIYFKMLFLTFIKIFSSKQKIKFI